MMRIAGAVLIIAAILVLGWDHSSAGGRVHDSSAGPLRVERMARGFDTPWALAFLPDGGKLVTERDGRLILIRPDWTRAPVAGVPEVEETGQGGLLDVMVPRDFATSREIFLSYTAPAGRATRTALARARLSPDGARLEDVSVLLEQDPAIDSGRHFGSRIVEALDGTLFLTIGDRAESRLAQDGDNLVGKVLRIARDGSVPPDNPFAGGVARPEIWSLGHRNPQGAALDGEGRLWTVEHGARGGDEVNRPEAGRNYGWPAISYGTHYSGAAFPGTHAPGMEQPVHYWDPSIAPSGLVVYSGRLWPEWAGDLFAGALKFRLIARLDRDGDTIRGEERLFEDEYGRIRDIREGPDGALWFLTNGSDPALYRITPKD